MKILIINVVCGIRSTGRLCADTAFELEALGNEVVIAYGRELAPDNCRKYAVRIGSDRDVKLHALKARMFDASGCGSKKATEEFIRRIRSFDPDVIHLHNIHGYYLHIETLFRYLRTCKKKIIWTLHDCWAFTGHAAYCEAAGCERWIDGCHHCPDLKDYPAALIDRSPDNWKKKKEIFSGVPNLTIVTPSVWLSSLVKKSFLSQYPLKIIRNGIDTDVFHPVNSDELRKELKLEGKKVLLGVNAVWDGRKGLEDFVRLNEMISNEYVLVLVGLNQKQLRELPPDIIGIARTDSVGELVKLYSLSDYYINLSYEDNYPTTNLEAIACGTPVITYRTGGSPESAAYYGTVVEKGDLDSVIKAVGSEPVMRLSDRSELDYHRTVGEYLELIRLSEASAD